jgi:hypothetical protein
VATHWTNRLENFKRSLNKFNYPYVILGNGEKWEGWNWRTKKYLNYLLTLDDNHIVGFVDAYDVLALRDSSNILHTFLSFKKNIVVGAEWYCGSKENCISLNNWWSDRVRAYRQHVNCGFIMGYAKDLKEMYKQVINYSDDQYGISTYLETYQHLFALDVGSSLVYNSHILDGQFHANAFFAHFPGPIIKHGLDNLYNNYCKNILGKNCYKQYPSEYLEVIQWFLVFFIICCVLIV